MKSDRITCRQANRIEPLLPDYLQHHLAPDREREVTAHLETCPTCQARAAEYRRTLELVAVDPVPEIDGERMLLDIRRKVRLAQPAARPQLTRPGLRAWRWVPVLAATATILIAVLVFRPGTRAPAFDAELAALLASPEESAFDPLSTDTSDLPELTAVSFELVNEVETTLIETGDLEDMFDELSLDEQKALVKALENLYHYEKG